ncbi:MAG: lysophospholipase [Eubacteriales bacterium]|nr:lysophospholipase [Eubacteriales bacterium]
MEKKNGTITGLGGLELYWQAWLPESLRAVVLLIHGFGEHSGRYNNVVESLVPEGIGIYALDHRGHGRSKGLQGHVDSFHDYVIDVRSFFTQAVLPAAGNLPVFVLGHSMGSIIAMNYVAEYSEGLKGYILSGTGAASPISGGKVLQGITAFLSRMAPRARIKFPLPPEFISRDPEVVAAYKADELVHSKISFRLAQGMNAALTTGAKAIAGLDLPVLIQCGSEDESFAGQQELFDSLQSKDKTLKIYQGYKHEVYNELQADRQRALADLAAWLNQQINK